MAPEYLAMLARYLDSAGYEIVAYNVASADDDPAVARVVLSPAYPELGASLDSLAQMLGQ